MSFFLPSAWPLVLFNTFRMFSTALVCRMPVDSLSRNAWTSGLRFLPFRNWTLSLPYEAGGLTLDWSRSPASPGLLEAPWPDICPTLSGLPDFLRKIFILLMPPFRLPTPYFTFTGPGALVVSTAPPADVGTPLLLAKSTPCCTDCLLWTCFVWLFEAFGFRLTKFALNIFRLLLFC